MIERFEAPLPNGITLACRGAGPAHAPRVLFVHGFPEAAFVWDPVIEALAPRIRGIAPNLRGYAGSSAPEAVDAYRPALGVGDLVALIEQQGAPMDLVVAHDWGGALAWGLAAQFPQLLRRLLIVNAPHPAAFLRELRDNPAQQAASQYMCDFQDPAMAARLTADGFAGLFARLHSPWWRPSETERAHYAEAWSAGLEGPLNYYRASPLRPPRPGDDVVRRLVMPDEAVTVRVPTRVLWAERDHALLPALLDGLARWVPELSVRRVAEASHWIVHEQPQTVVAEIEGLLGLPAGG